MPAAASTTTDPPTRRLVLLPREPCRGEREESQPRRYRLARLEATAAARAERFAYLKKTYD